MLRSGGVWWQLRERASKIGGAPFLASGAAVVVISEMIHLLEWLSVEDHHGKSPQAAAVG